MNFFQKTFGRKAKKAPALPEAIKNVKSAEDILQKKQVYLEEQIKKETAKAKKDAKSNKKAALQALRKKKRLERQLQRVDGALTTLEAQREVLDNANFNKLAVDSMQTASKALKAVHKDIDVDKVEQILDDLAAERETTDEIADAISHPVGFSDDEFDKDELERELAELTGNMSVDEILPSVPQQDVAKEEKKKREKALAAVAAS